MKQVYLFLFFLLFVNNVGLLAQSKANCVSGCNANAFISSVDPNTIEYDNMVSGFHSTILKESNGTIKVWGQSAGASGAHINAPTVVAPEYGFPYAGKILRITLASKNSGTNGVQFAILTTEGLYVWGHSEAVGTLVVEGVKGGGFGKLNTGNMLNTNAYGLPADVHPTDVKMLFGSYLTLGIVTCTGEAWMLSGIGGKNGQGSAANTHATTWTRVQIAQGVNLTNVVAMRGTYNAMMALTNTGDIYTWGTGTYLGNNTSSDNSRRYATKMTLPIGVKPKMIGMTYNKSGNVQGNSYYILSTTGDLYALGNNESKQLGDYTTESRTSWIRVKSVNSTTNMPAISWFSPNEHDYAGFAAVNALTMEGKLWSWGSNAGQMIGGGSEATMNPMTMGRGLDDNDQLIAVETGGHTTMVIRQCSQKYGYIGHKSNGSMGDGSNLNDNVSTFDFKNTAEVNLCGAPTGPPVQDIVICPNTAGDLATAHTAHLPVGISIEWWTTANRIAGTQVSNPGNVGVGTYYAFYIPTSGNCTAPPASVAVNVKLLGSSGCDVDLGIIKSVNNQAPKVGEIITFTIEVENKSQHAVVAGTVTDAVPTGYTIGAIGSGGVNTSGAITWELGAMAAGEIKTVSFETTVLATGTLDNTATVAVSAPQADTDPTNNSSTVNVKLCKAPSGQVPLTKTTITN